MAEPKGLLMVPVGFRSDGSIHALELDNSDRLKVLIDSITNPVVVTQTNPANLLTGIHVFDGASWQKALTHGEGAVIVAPHPEEFWRDAAHTQILTSNSCTNTEVTLYTVPSSTVAFITSMHLSAVNAAAADSIYRVRIYNATPTLVVSFNIDVLKNFVVVSDPAFTVPLYLQAGWSIRTITDHATTTGRLSIHGFSQPA